MRGLIDLFVIWAAASVGGRDTVVPASKDEYAHRDVIGLGMLVGIVNGYFFGPVWWYAGVGLVVGPLVLFFMGALLKMTIGWLDSQATFREALVAVGLTALPLILFPLTGLGMLVGFLWWMTGISISSHRISYLQPRDSVLSALLAIGVAMLVGFAGAFAYKTFL